MTYLVISDIHGSYKFLNKVLKAFNDFKCDKIICLGDLLYHGPRNDLPEEYNPKKCIELLNSHKDKIISVQGNCDAEVDQMVLDFEIGKPRFENINDYQVYLTHGHHLEDVPKNAKIVLYGHTHIAKIDRVLDVLMINPGSISIPKGKHSNSFGIIKDNNVNIYDFSYNIIMESKL